MPEPHPLIAVLIAAPGARTLQQGFIDAAGACLAAHCAPWPSAPLPRIRCLSAGDAYEIAFHAGADFDPLPLAQRLRALSGAPQFDLAVLPAGHRRKHLLVSDMESTIIQQECLDELADYLGLRDPVATITERAMRGELDFAAALRERVQLLKGLAAETLAEVYRQRVTLMPGAQTLIATMRAHGATCALVSGGFTFFAERVAARLSFDVQQANRLEIAEGRIAGTVAEPILGGEAKLAVLQRLSASLGVPRELTLAVGDGANDIAMIKAAGLGVAFRARPVVAREATVSIVHGDLTALLYLQGYCAAEFAHA
jgi:phosphoserine phosphatase